MMSSFDPHFYHDDPVDFVETPRKRKFSSIVALLALFVGAGLYVQTTLASNIALNTGAPVEFGQGVTQLTSCTGSSVLTLTPTSTFVNASSAEEAVKAAFHFSDKGDVVLLSPACASFDLFKNYEDRGNQFKTAVKNL